MANPKKGRKKGEEFLRRRASLLHAGADRDIPQRERAAGLRARQLHSELPAIKLGGRGVWRVDRRQLDEYLETLMMKTRECAQAHRLNAREREGLD
jgi:hypothetical protein